MKKLNLNILSNVSNRTKVIGGVTIIGAIAAGISMIVDAKQVSEIETAEVIDTSMAERLEEAVEEVASAVEDAAEAIGDEIEDLVD